MNPILRNFQVPEALTGVVAVACDVRRRSDGTSSRSTYMISRNPRGVVSSRSEAAKRLRLPISDSVGRTQAGILIDRLYATLSLAPCPYFPLCLEFPSPPRLLSPRVYHLFSGRYPAILPKDSRQNDPALCRAYSIVLQWLRNLSRVPHREAPLFTIVKTCNESDWPI